MAKTTQTSAIQTVQASVIQRNIYDQLQASRDIFEIIPTLAELARKHPEDKELEKALEGIMKKLLYVGECLAESASDTGGNLNLID